MRRGELKQQLLGELLLGRPAAIDGRLADACTGSDVLQPHRGEPVGDQQLAGGGEDGLVRALTARSPAVLGT